MRLQGKTAIVTGGARGIGLAMVELFAREGATVFALDRDLSTTPTTIDGVTWMTHDVTQESDWQTTVERVITKTGNIDILLNNAGGVGSYEPIDTIELTDWNRIIDLNINGTFLGMRHVIPQMKRQGRGSIVNVSSIWGIAGAAGVAAYTASKGAVRLMSKNAALSYVNDGIRVNSLHPGIISTPMIAAQDSEITAGVVSSTPMGRLGTPEEIAYGALFLASDEASFVTGTELVVDGGYTAQ